MLIVTGLVLVFTNFIPVANHRITLLNAICMGCAQAIAIIPGISRSGFTIATALFCKIKREKAAEFSFLMALVPITGGTILKLAEFLTTESNDEIEVKGLIIAFLSAFLAGLFACKYMISIVNKNNLKYFGYYCITFGCFFWWFI